MVHQKETERTIGAMMKVHRDIGPGLDESIYQNACEEEFTKQGIQHEPQASRWIMHRDQRVKERIPDFLIEDKFILDLKAIFGEFPKPAYAQVLCYCKLLQVRLGMLVNFGNQSATTTAKITSARF